MSGVKVIDHGLDKIVRESVRLGDLEIAAGILPNHFDDAYDNGMTIGEVATIQVYGTSTIPKRDFIGGTADAYREKTADVMQKQVGLVLDGSLTPEAAAADLGKWFHGRINAHIDNGPWARNAPSTVKKKGRDDPLKDTKLLYNAIDHEVRKK
ncbi:MAG: hypothetical protein WBA82_08010 [Castellaniella sp.]|uniref:hypothetical protein n=1 Tax=Castellaniella sp. TaxID=1955812 RepID=UPI003C7761BD